MKPAYYPIYVVSDDHFLTQFLRWVYQSEPDYFNYSKVIGWLREEYTVNVKQPPTLKLSPPLTAETPSANVLIQLSAVEIGNYNYDRGQQGATIDSATFDIGLSGTLEVVDSQLTLGQLKAKVTGGNWLDTSILSSILKYVLPELEKRVQAIPLPQLQQVVGTSLTTSLNDIKIEGNCLHVGADVRETVTSVVADRGGSSDGRLTLPQGDETTGYLAIAAHEQVVNRLIDTMLPRLQKQFEEVDGDDFNAIGIKAQVDLTLPTVTLNEQSISGTITIATQLQGGLKLMGEWTWMDIPVATSQASLVADIAKSPDGTTVLLRFRQLKNIALALPLLPPLLESAREPLAQLLNAVASAFKDDISAALKTVEIPLFTLPATVPGTDIPADLQFADCAVEPHRVRAIIQVKPARE